MKIPKHIIKRELMNDEDMINAIADAFIVSKTGTTFEQFFDCYFKSNVVDVMYQRQRLEMGR